MVWLGSTTQLSKKYTTGTPSDTRYCARFPKVSDELLDTVHVPVKPVSHPFSSTTGGRVAPDGTVCLGFTTIANVVTRSSPASLMAESLAVYSPGFVRGGAASSTRSYARRRQQHPIVGAVRPGHQGARFRAIDVAVYSQAQVCGFQQEVERLGRRGNLYGFAHPHLVAGLLYRQRVDPGGLADGAA